MSKATQEQIDKATVFGMPGVYGGIPMKQYHAGAGLSRSGLLDVAKSPATYYAKRVDPKRPPEPEKKGHIEGTLAHTMILERETFPLTHAIVPEDAPTYPSISQWNAKAPSAKSVADMKWWTDFSELHAGKTFVTQKQVDVAQWQADNVMKIAEVRDLLKSGKAEQSAYAKDPETGIVMRVRPDWASPQGGGTVLLDVKTTGDAEEGAFGRMIALKKYHVQDVFYSDVYALASEKPVLGFLFVPVESTYPYAANVVMLDDESRDAARMYARRAINTYAESFASGKWPGFAPGVKVITLPKYVFADAGSDE